MTINYKISVVFTKFIMFQTTLANHSQLQCIEDIYFFEVNTKYISSNVMKISVNSRVRSTKEFSDIFNT